MDGPLIAQPAEPPYTDPYVRWCDRDSGRPPTYVDRGVAPSFRVIGKLVFKLL